MGMTVKFDNPIDNFYSKGWKVCENGCWEYKGTINTNGYGQLSFHGGRRISAHRLSYMIYNGSIPEGMLVCHKCDNKKCVNPKHLFLGTCKDNMEDASEKNRWPKYSSVKQIRKLSEQQIEDIKDLIGAYGMKVTNVAKIYGVCRDSIYNAINGITHKQCV